MSNSEYCAPHVTDVSVTHVASDKVAFEAPAGATDRLFGGGQQ